MALLYVNMRNKRFRRALFLFVLGLFVFNFPFLEVIDAPLAEGTVWNTLFGLFLLWFLFIVLLFQLSRRI